MSDADEEPNGAVEERARAAQSRSKRPRSSPAAAGGSSRRSAPRGGPRALPSRKWMMYAGPVVAGTFRVLSFNVLADYIVQRDHAGGGAKYDWTHRRGRLVREILAWSPHIVCLQEVDHFEDCFEPELKRCGFVGFYKRRTGAETLDGCAIFVQQSTVRVLAARPIEFFRSEHDPVLNRHNVALALVVALESAPAVPFVVATTHLLFNPARGDVKLAQLQLLLDALAEMRAPSTDAGEHHVTDADASSMAAPLPVVLCGDFNMSPHSALYHFVSTGELDASGLSRYHLSGQKAVPGDGIQRALFANERDQTRHHGHGTAPGKFDAAKARRSDWSTFPRSSAAATHQLELSSAYAQRPTRESTGEPKFTTFHSGTKATVDYMWYSRRSVHCHGVAEMPPAGALFAQRELPTRLYPSDHLSLVAIFSLCATHPS